MKAKQLIEGATLDPHQLKIVGQAFDEAWEQIRPSISNRAEAIEAARLKLAKAVLAVAKDGGAYEVERIKAAALKAMYAAPTELGTKPKG